MIGGTPDFTACFTASSMTASPKAHSWSAAIARAWRRSWIPVVTSTSTYELARQHGLTLALAIETHVHADFVSGAHELASAGAEIVAGPGAGLRIPHREARDAEQFRLGDLTITALHTPGHTPEHISLLIEHPGDPQRVLTGDTLFVGAVGRPDLLGAERGRELAGHLYVSIFQKLLALADDVEVHPGHGAGSLCGSGIGNELHSTIGQERRFNPMLQHRTQAAFVEAVLRDLPETPPYFTELKRLNQQGPPLLHLAGGIPAVPALSPADAHQAVKQGATLIDLRQAPAFAQGYASGALNIGYGPKIGYWAGWVVPLTSPVVLLHDGDLKRIDTARLELLRIGIDNVVGYVEGGFDGVARGRTADLSPRKHQCRRPASARCADRSNNDSGCAQQA